MILEGFYNLELEKCSGDPYDEKVDASHATLSAAGAGGSQEENFQKQ